MKKPTKTTLISRRVKYMDLEAALIDLGVRIFRSTDTEITAWCPMHRERIGRDDGRASWSINRETGLFNCYSCEYRGMLPNLINDLLFDGQNLWAALGWLRECIGTDLTIIDELEQKPKQARESWREHPVTDFFGDTIPEKQLRKRKITQAMADKYGVKWDSSRLAWILPIEVDGQQVGYQIKAPDYLRNFPSHVKKGRALFGLRQAIGTPAFILVESPLDVVRLADMGIPGGVASYGAGVTEHQMNLILENALRLIVAMDNDLAGIASANKLAKLYARRIPMFFFNYGSAEGKDVGEMNDDDVRWGIRNTIHAVERALQ